MNVSEKEDQYSAVSVEGRWKDTELLRHLRVRPSWVGCSRLMGSLTFGVVSGTDKTQTATYGSDGSRLGEWTILNGPAQKTARVHHFVVENEYVFNV